MSKKVQIWDCKSGKVSAVKISGIIFKVKEDAPDDAVLIANKFLEIFEMPSPAFFEIPKEEPKVNTKEEKKTTYAKARTDLTTIGHMGSIPIHKEPIEDIMMKIPMKEVFGAEIIKPNLKKFFPDLRTVTMDNRVNAYMRYLVEKGKAEVVRTKKSKKFYRLIKMQNPPEEEITAQLEKEKEIQRDKVQKYSFKT